MEEPKSVSPCQDALVKRKIHLEKILCLSNAAVATDSARKALDVMNLPQHKTGQGWKPAFLDLHAVIMPERNVFGSSSQAAYSRSTPVSPLDQYRIWCRPCAVVCVVGRRLQSDYSDADSLGRLKALGYCAECASHIVRRHMCMRSDRPASGGDSGWIRGM